MSNEIFSKNHPSTAHFIKGIWVLLILAFLAQPTLATNSCSPEAGSGAVSGYALMEFQTVHTAISIGLSNISGSSSFRTKWKKTNEAGFYCFPREIPAGTYKVRVVMQNYQERSSQLFQVQVGQTTTIPPVTLPRQLGALEGHILLKGQTNHSGTQVEIQGKPFATHTKKDGSFRFNDVPAYQGYYTIWASHECYKRTRLYTDVTVKAGQVNSVSPKTLDWDYANRANCQVWCCLGDRVFQTTRQQCLDQGGKCFLNRWDAVKSRTSARYKLKKESDQGPVLKKELRKLYVLRPPKGASRFAIQMKELKTALEKSQVNKGIIILLKIGNGNPINLGTYNPRQQHNRQRFAMPRTKLLPASLSLNPKQKMQAARLTIKTTSGKILASMNIQLVFK